MSFSVADELIKYKELLDVGVISQEEFDKKNNNYWILINSACVA